MSPSVVDTPVDALRLLEALPPSPAFSRFQRVLMVSPESFDVRHAINPHMKDSEGNLNRVDKRLAEEQWHSLKGVYTKLGYAVEVIAAPPELPDMVFAANQSLVYWDEENQAPTAVLSRMRSQYRAPEVAHFAEWYETEGYQVKSIAFDGGFEGTGDALGHPGLPLLWGGYGPRTDKRCYDAISEATGLSVVRLELTRPEYYHLDTCLSILDSETAVIAPEAFTEEGKEILARAFPCLISVNDEENLFMFLANCHSPNGGDVIVQRGSQRFRRAANSYGFQVHEVDTTEFIKSGGSVFCLKMMVI